MRTRCYVSEDGEVLSNKDYPVDSPTVILPVLPKPTRYILREDGMPSLAYEERRYHAVTITDGKE